MMNRQTVWAKLALTSGLPTPESCSGASSSKDSKPSEPWKRERPKGTLGGAVGHSMGGAKHGLIKKGLDHGLDIRRELLMGRDDEIAIGEHAGSIGSCVQHGVVQIFNHGPGLPSPHEAGVEGGDFGTQHGCGSPSTQSAEGDVLGVDAQGRANDGTA